MHILYIHQHFATPEGSTGTRSYEFARRWIQCGHKVTVLTGYYDLGGLQAGQGVIQRQSIDGINIIVVVTKYSNKQSFFRRIISFFSFLVFATYTGLREQGVDVIYATSTPLTVGIPAMIIKWLRRKPFVFEVRDQWPEIPIELGIIRNKIMIKFFLWLEKTIYNNSSGIVALSPGQADGIRKVLTCDKEISVIPNSCDTTMFRPDIEGSAIRKKYGWGDKLVFLHAGAIGKANSLDFVIEAAGKVKHKDDIHFVLIGDGGEKPALIKKIQEEGLTNVELRDPVSKTELPEIFAASDISMVVFANYPILEHNSANKFFDSLSAGKPILLNYGGWQRKILEDNGAGFGCGLYNLDEFIEKVLYLHCHREDLRKMGENGRRIAMERFNRNDLANQALSLIESVVEIPDTKSSSYAK
ncbi:MAG: glycosyltransferase family 4 protein [Planctomycetota bacterium]|jgi:glycosyltransferase involved in cell wall biosynthesis